MRAMLWFPLLFLVYSGYSSAAGPPVTEESLSEVAASLKMYVDELPQMPRLHGYSISKGSVTPTKLTIGMYEKDWKFHRDLPPTKVFVYGTSKAAATFPGPAIEAIQGVPLSVTWLNFLPRRHFLPWDPTIPTAIPKRGGVPTVVHLHSGVNPPHSDGSALAWFTAGFKETGSAWSRATYTYPNVQHSGNLWYHDHALGMIPANLLAGLLGTYTIRDPVLDAKLNLPSGIEFDRQLVIADRSFTKDGSLYLNATGVDPSVHPQWHPEFFGDVITVNGKAWPYMKVQRRKYRLRILNAGNARYLGLSLSNGLPFTVVASDSSYLPQPVVTSRLLLAPSEITDVIVDFSKSKTREIELQNDAQFPFPAGELLAGVVEGCHEDEVHHPLRRDQQRLRPARAAVHQRADPAGSGDGDAEAGDDRAVECHKPHGGQPPAPYPSGFVQGHQGAGTFGAGGLQELHGEEEGRAEVQRQSPRRRRPRPRSGIREDVEECREDRTRKHDQRHRQVQPGGGDKPFPFDATAEPGYVYHCHILDHEGNGMIRPLKLVS
ncbi:unnamed protein product [Spirodela intermedia]|uniref:Plastocyanin-like domain-containing protein n=1 Tax=Spirodela intermedia TaxID=51605 RepID=A0A7I8JPN3_SPIIN|nr:unnamed protein product [Spirodela intermedia]CAA6671392.1 unnamed protein product [Spirodela intermedia]